MDAKDYTCRCDKHNLRPYEYCEMCMIRTKLQIAIETNRKTVEHACASMQLSINVIRDVLDKQQKQINELIKLEKSKDEKIKET